MPYLYHYTTGENFVKIIESGELWATQISCLNDAQECQSYCRLIREETDKRRSADNGGVLPKTIFESLSGISEGVIAEKLPMLPLFVACFSTESDDLSQWRAYSQGREGYAIGIEAGENMPVGCRLVRVQYEPEEQRRLVKGILDVVEKFVGDQDIFQDLERLHPRIRQTCNRDEQ
ncbi:hypothetical protein [Methylacidimicrobium cyclopophantes]|nr:hypothetical protein [Methylacidimicrobium cyclopophantes]